MRSGEGSWYRRRHLLGNFKKQVKELFDIVLSILFTVDKYVFSLAGLKNPLMEHGRSIYPFAVQVTAK